MRPAGKLREHLARVFAGARLAQYVPVEHHLGVRGNDDGRPHSARGDKLRLSVSKSLHQFRRRFTRDRGLVNSRREHSERQPGIMQNFSAANRSGSKNQFHAVISAKDTTGAANLKLSASPETGKAGMQATPLTPGKGLPRSAAAALHPAAYPEELLVFGKTDL